ncbi:DUF977 family protein [Citrobacter cronae]|uniref:DUF977 family protein n=1 Tax=Citrobacter cronae TaxID=1748967 RepID=UPI0021CE6D71|nr:DUF977 family protein [Citrobacter cronae]MCU6199087.1 DUF977 family protein [Citrobacter cronae]
MARIFTEAEKIEIVKKITSLIRSEGRATLSQLVDELGISQPSVRHYLSIAIDRCGFYRAGKSGVFPTQQHFQKWREKRAIALQVKISGARPVIARPVITIKPYDKTRNVICQECRNSPVMRRVLAFYRPGVSA